MKKLIGIITVSLLVCSCSMTLHTIKYGNSKVKYTKENRGLKRDSDKYRCVEIKK